MDGCATGVVVPNSALQKRGMPTGACVFLEGKLQTLLFLLLLPPALPSPPLVASALTTPPPLSIHGLTWLSFPANEVLNETLSLSHIRDSNPTHVMGLLRKKVPEERVFRLVVLGGPGTGKLSLTAQVRIYGRWRPRLPLALDVSVIPQNSLTPQPSTLSSNGRCRH